jgi:hypothetical protein
MPPEPPSYDPMLLDVLAKVFAGAALERLMEEAAASPIMAIDSTGTIIASMCQQLGVDLNVPIDRGLQ